MHSTVVWIGILLFAISNTKTVADKDVVFKLFRSDDPTSHTVLQKKGNFLNSLFHKPYFSKAIDKNLPTRIYIYDFNETDETIDKFRGAILNAGNFNLIIVDWKNGANKKDFASAKIAANDVCDVTV